MIPIERHQRILALVEQRGAVSINELTEILGVSHMTTATLGYACYFRGLARQPLSPQR